MDSKQVEFVSIDFNNDSLEEKLKSSNGFLENQLCVVTLGGVTQYITKESTAETLKTLKNLTSPGSTLLITYVDERCLGDSKSSLFSHRMVMGMASKVGEPWISAFNKKDFESFLKDCAYLVVSDTSITDYNESSLEAVGRKLEE